MDKEILLHIIDGPGTGLTFMVLGFFALICILVLSRWSFGYDTAHARAVAAGREAERREGFDQIRAQLAKLSFDQQQMISRIAERSNAVDEQVG